MAWVDPRLGTSACRFESHLDSDGAASRPVQHPRRLLARFVWSGSDDDIVCTAHVEQLVQIDLEGRRERQQDVEADRPLTCLDPADGGGTELGASRELVERQAEGVTEATQTS